MTFPQKCYPGSSRHKLRPDIGYGLGRAGYGFANELTLTVATVFMLGRGLSFGSIGLVWAVYLTVSCVLNVPTGAWADQAGRRTVYAIGMLLLGAGQIGYGLSHTAGHFFVSAVLFGLGAAATSGALQAWVVDAQLALGQENSVPRILANTQALTSIAGIGAGLFVGLLYFGPLHGIYMISGGTFICVGVLLFVLVSENYGSSVNRLVTMKKSIKFFISCRPLLLVAYVMLTAYAGFMAFLFTWQPRALEVGWPETRLGLLYTAYLACMAFGSYIAGLVLRNRLTFGTAQAVSSLAIAAGVSVIVLGSNLVQVMIGICLFAVGFGVFVPTVGIWINDYSPSEIRASLLSVVNTVALGSAAVLQVVMGYAIDVWGFTAALVGGGSIAITGTIAVIVLFGKTQKHYEQLS